MEKVLRIGIILTRVKAEKKKNELVCSGTKRPWLSKASKKLGVLRNKKRAFPGDASVGVYIMNKWEGIEVDFMCPEDVTPVRLKMNQINFMLIYDVLESFHVDRPEVYRRFVNSLKGANNVYPPYSYQKFINNKCNYIKHLTNRNADYAIPTMCVTKFDQGTKAKVIEFGEKMGGTFIGKPIFGQESIDFKKFDAKASLRSNSPLDKYIKRCSKKYPGIIFQKYIEGFDASNPEIRMYFLADKYRYSVITNDVSVRTPKQENGNMTVEPFEALKRFAKKIVDGLPPIKVGGTDLGRMLTRVDIACGPKFAKPWIVNEIEFVPSLYIEDVRYVPEPELGDFMVAAAKKVCKQKFPIKLRK